MAPPSAPLCWGFIGAVFDWVEADEERWVRLKSLAAGLGAVRSRERGSILRCTTFAATGYERSRSQADLGGNESALDLDTGAERQLTHLPPDFDIRDFDISPDGQELVLERVTFARLQQRWRLLPPRVL